MSSLDIESVVEESVLPIDVANKYLKLYVADIEWEEHIVRLWNLFLKKESNENVAKDQMKRAIACATILPLAEKVPIPDPPHNLLFWCTRWEQFNRDDWFDIYKSVLKEDLEISKKRNIIISEGVIDPIDVLPMTRQAFNWLYENVKEDKTVREESLAGVKDKISNLVRAYGGAVICNIFMNHKHHVNGIPNWRSGYFFEREIHKVYTVDQILKIKKAELAKTNNKYVIKVNKSGVKNV